MKHFLRLGTFLLLALTFLFLLASCADGPAGSGEDGEDEVIIGILAPLSGPAARFGTAVRDGVMLYIDGFNAQGGLQIRPIIFDEEGDVGQAVIGYHSLVDQGITALIGSVTSQPTMAVVPEAHADGMPMITATSTHFNVTVNAANGEVWNNVFRSCFIDPFQGVKMAEFAHEILGAQTAAVLYSNDIDYSIGLMESFIQRAGELGMQIVATEVFAQDAVDYVGQLTNIAAANPDVLFVPAYVEHVALIGPQSEQVGLDAIIIGADGWDGVLDIMAEGQRATLEGSFHMTGFTVEDETPMVQDFISRFTETVGNPPDMFSAQAYDAAMILIAAIERALADGHAPNTDAFKASVIAHMAATNMTAVTGHITFDHLNNPQKTAVIIQFINGEPRLWGTF
ncbi:MAG: ABC transporter substrate-binding protein [Defluviitaleaceae bacterium]|nr:ABC transporter substrate-binding protein [Defluviitaleaceae bacterium]